MLNTTYTYLLSLLHFCNCSSFVLRFSTVYGSITVVSVFNNSLQQYCTVYKYVDSEMKKRACCLVWEAQQSQLRIRTCTQSERKRERETSPKSQNNNKCSFFQAPFSYLQLALALVEQFTLDALPVALIYAKEAVRREDETCTMYCCHVRTSHVLLRRAHSWSR